MEYAIHDRITLTELTPENLVRCLDGYLDTVKTADNDTVLDLMDYIEYAVLFGDNDLTRFAVNRIRATLLGY